MAAHDGLGLVDDAPAENKKGARCQPHTQVVENPKPEAVLRPSQALLVNNKQDITRTDNHYTSFKPSRKRFPRLRMV